MATEDSDDRALLTDLDWQSQEILKHLYEHGEKTTTTEIKDRSRITDTDAITYRFRRASTALEPNGLIDVHEPELTVGQRNKPLQATLTEKGERLAERVIERGGETSDLDERLEKIEATLGTLEETIDESARSPELEEVTDVNSRLEAVERRVDHLEDAVQSELGAWSSEKQHEYKLVVEGTRTVRDFLIQEYEEEFKNYVRTHLDG